VTALVFVVVAAVFTLVRVLATAGQPGGQIPWRTLAINVGGALLLGLATSADLAVNSVIYAGAGLGSLTTFSTVAAEAAALLDDGHKRTAIAYVGITLVVGIAAAWLGIIIGESL